MTANELTMLPGQQGNSALADAPQEVQDALGEAGDGLVKGTTIFRRSKSGGPVLLGYQLRGLLKEAYEAHTDIPQPASKVDKFMYVSQFEIPIVRDGSPLAAVDGEVDPAAQDEGRRARGRSASAS